MPSRYALPPSPRAQEYVYIRRVSDAAAEGEVFAELEKRAGDAVTDLAKRACAEFGWGVPTQVRLYLIPHAPCGDEPPEEAEAKALCCARLQSGWSLEHAGIVMGSWLLARVSGPVMESGASCVCASIIWNFARAPSHRRPRPPSLFFSYAQALLEWRRVRRRVHPSRRSSLR